MARVDAAFEELVQGLSARDGKLFFTPPDRDDPVAVTVRYLRALVGEALRERYHLAVIRRVREIDVRFGTRYWKVETDRGARWFALREPGKNVTWIDRGHPVPRDTAGNRYEIEDLDALDSKSRKLVGRSL